MEILSKCKVENLVDNNTHNMYINIYYKKKLFLNVLKTKCTKE